jgi:hypothetical protein
MRVLIRMHGALYLKHALCGAKSHIPISRDYRQLGFVPRDYFRSSLNKYHLASLGRCH